MLAVSYNGGHYIAPHVYVSCSTSLHDSFQKGSEMSECRLPPLYLLLGISYNTHVLQVMYIYCGSASNF